MSSLPVDLRIILISGARRTGTTLMNQIICSDPGANSQVGEARIITKFLEAFAWADDSYDTVVKWYFESQQGYEEFKSATINALLGHAYDALKPRDKLVLKAPAFSGLIDEAMQWLPNSQFLICIRHPLDQVASELEVGQRQLQKNSKKTGRAAARDVAGLARTYFNRYTKFLSASEEKPGKFVFVRFEDVVTSPDETIRSLERDLNVDLSAFDPEKEWVDFKNKEELSRMPAHVEQYGAPIDSSRVGRHEGVLTDDEAAEVRTICAPILERFYNENAT
ncbi:MAG: sulfotransferase [Pseudomonadota bacterium]